jgi:hypothetical protein
MRICKPQAPRDRCIAGQREAFSFGGTGSVGPWIFRRGGVGVVGRERAVKILRTGRAHPSRVFVGGTGSVGPWFCASDRYPSAVTDRRYRRRVSFVAALYERRIRHSSDGRSPSLRYSSDRRSRSLQGRSVGFARRSRYSSAVADRRYRRQVCFVAALYERRIRHSSDGRSPSLQGFSLEGPALSVRDFCASERYPLGGHRPPLQETGLLCRIRFPTAVGKQTHAVAILRTGGAHPSGLFDVRGGLSCGMSCPHFLQHGFEIPREKRRVEERGGVFILLQTQAECTQ